MGAVVGIDLGTTYSALARVNEAGLPEVIPNVEGEKITPSVVLFDRDTAVVGAIAKEALLTEPENVVQLVKRQMGSSWTFTYDGEEFRPEQISALILRKVVQDAEELIGHINRAVITVPAYFNDAQRHATRVAGEIAGLEILALINEPTSAAIAFGLQRSLTDATIAVFDLGGGTFDITVMHIDGGDLTVLATGGDNFLGGTNFDKKIYDYFVQRFEEQFGLNVEDPDVVEIEELVRIAQDWLRRAERLKRDLTLRSSASAALTALGKTMRVDLTRVEFERMSRILQQEMDDKTRETLASAQVRSEDIDLVLLAGGATRMPMVRQQAREIFGREPNTSVSPDEAVALGAALFGVNRAINEGIPVTMPRQRKEYLGSLTVTDVAAHSLGIEAYDVTPAEGGKLHNSIILPRNVSLPFETHKTYYTVEYNQTEVEFKVLEGEEAEVELCLPIGNFSISGLPRNRPNGCALDVTMRYDRDGILNVEAVDRSTHMRAQTTIYRQGSLSPTEQAQATAVVEKLAVE